jgi:PhnB protein
MGSRLNPYISYNYNGNARQATEFYQEVFGGALEMGGTVSDFGSPDSPNADELMYARLDTPTATR